MPFGARMVVLGIGIFLFLLVFELVRRGKFREELSIAWLFVAVGLMLSPFADTVVDPVARALGIGYPPVLVFLGLTLLFILAMLYFSYMVSDLKSKNKELTQKLVLLEHEVKSIQPDQDSKV